MKRYTFFDLIFASSARLSYMRMKNLGYSFCVSTSSKMKTLGKPICLLLFYTWGNLRNSWYYIAATS